MSDEAEEAYRMYLHNQARGEDDRPREQEEEEYQEEMDRIEEEKWEVSFEKVKMMTEEEKKKLTTGRIHTGGKVQ